MEHFFFEFANPIGYMGVALVLFAYFAMQIQRMSAHGVTYSLTNAIGSVLILVSLYFYRNMASLVIEIAWLLISVYGLSKALMRKQKST